MQYKLPDEIYLVSTEGEDKTYQYIKQALRCLDRWNKEGKPSQIFTYVRKGENEA